jgi:alpha-glucosidase (family GH31 glycosyl hydrolase)
MKTNREYGDAYYRAFYRYVASRRSDAIITARPFDGGTIYAPIEANPAGWVGDQEPDWGPRGIEEALDNILASAELGYSMLGSDIGGYRPGERFDRLFVRWTQLGALSPLMENGGRGEHRPWEVGEVTVEPYRYYAKLHRQLIPYLYGLGVEAHLGGEPIIRDPDRQARDYRLGDDLFVAPVLTRDNGRRVELPRGSRWYDYWDDAESIAGGTVLDYQAPLHRMPIFIRSGAIIPMQVADGITGHGGTGSAGALTLILYPDGVTKRTLHPDAGRELRIETRRESGSTTVALGTWHERLILRIQEERKPTSIGLRVGNFDRTLPGVGTFADLEQLGEGWTHDAENGYLWVRLPAPAADAVLQYPGGQ